MKQPNNEKITKTGTLEEHNIIKISYLKKTSSFSKLQILFINSN